MFGASFGLAVSAGILAAVNPCGFAMLPAYVSMLITGETSGGTPASWPVRLRRAFALTGAMTLGFVTFFGAFGLLAAPAADWLAQRLPWLTIIIGLVLLALGLWLLTGRELPSPVPRTGRAPQLRRRFWPMFGFGVTFAIASLGCTVGPFLAVVVTSFTADSTATGIGLFTAYAMGMALIIGTVSVAIAGTQQATIKWLRRFAPIVSRAAGLLMAIAGAYVAWYGWYEVRVLAGDITDDPIIDIAANAQTWLTAQAGRIGPWGFVAIVLLAAGLGLVITRRRKIRI